MEVAIVGMGCRFPGDAKGNDDIETPSALWDFLHRKGDAYTDFPADRLNLDGWYHPQVGRPGSFYTQGGCFLKADPRQFDPSLFGISPHEARTLDPSQRKLLETVYEAFESSGTPLSKLHGSSTGCFIGNFNYDHQLMQFRDAEYPEPYAMTGGGIALLSNRISYIFNLHGPSLTLDTACSSSMYALHLACSAIQSGECTAAVVGGSNLILTPECQMFSAALGAVSRSSKCHTFDAAADGYARAEGIGVLYIKSLRQAIEENDPIRAVIRATAINANGRTGGITHPDADGQERAIRRAYQRAGDLDPGLTSFFECHGTGTPVGDPIEVEAVGRVFAAGRNAERPLYIGSVKSNMGHCEAASGIAGIMKTVLAIENSIIPPLRGLNSINPNVNLHEGRLNIVRESIRWPECAVRRASVNSFGYGGSNAHTILEEADNLAPGHGAARARPSPSHIEDGDSVLATGYSSSTSSGTSPTKPISLFSSRVLSPKHLSSPAQPISNSRRFFLLPFSAHNEPTLKGNISALIPWTGRWQASDLAYTLGCRRSSFSARYFMVASRGEIETNSLTVEDIVPHRAQPSHNQRIGFVFTGQGAQWPQMGRELIESFYIYAESIRRMDKVLRQVKYPPNWSIEDALRAPAGSSQVYEPALSQPLVTAIQVALVDLLDSWNIRPAASVGHSSGEIAAAYASGRVSAAEAIIIAYTRGRTIADNSRKGAMLAVSIGAQALEPLLAGQSSIAIACHNSPESTTLSGDREPIVAFKAVMEAQNIFARLLETGGNAYHSIHMKDLGERYEQELDELLSCLEPGQRLAIQPPSEFVSSVTDSVVIEGSIPSSYWRKNLESPVWFSQAVKTLINSCPVDYLIELGPHTALRGPVRHITRSIKHSALPEYISSLVRSSDGAKCVLNTAGKLWANGYDVDLRAISTAYRSEEDADHVQSNAPKVIVDLPKYQWQYGDMLYSENRWTREWRMKSHLRHDLLGSRQQGGNRNEPMWRNVLRHKSLPWLKDHQIGSDIVFPAAGYLLMAVEAAMQMTELYGTPRSNVKTCICEDVKITSALTIPEDTEGVEVLFNLRRSRLNSHAYHSNRYEFTISSVTNVNNTDIFTEHGHGSLAVATVSNETARELDSDSCKKPISEFRWYTTFSSVGLNYGRSFRCMSKLHVSGKVCDARCTLNTDATRQMVPNESHYHVHPTVLDSAIQLAIVAAHKGRSSECVSAFIPISVSRMIVSMDDTNTGPKHASAKVASLEHSSILSDVSITNASDQTLIRLEGLELAIADGILPPAILPESHPFSRLDWQPELDLLTTEKSKELYPSGYDHVNASNWPPIEELALNQIIQFYAQYPHLFDQGSKISSLQRFLEWMIQKVDLARQNSLSGGRKAFEQSVPERQAVIEMLSTRLKASHGPQTRLMCHMYESLPRIYSGELSGIQVAVHNNYLSDMYEHAELFHRGSRALQDVVALLSHKNPALNIFEVGGGTGSATKEILRGLRGDKQFRGYESYTFTDVTPSFLAGAQETFSQYRGVRYAAFDMEKPAKQQGFNATHDLVIASNAIHATVDIQDTLTNVRSLLKPGGKLVLFEVVRPMLAWMMTLGTFSDAWKGDHDPRYPRTEGPFLTLSMWNAVLPRCGFSGIDVSLDHFAEYKDAAVILSTAVELNPPLCLSAPLCLPILKQFTIVHRAIPSLFVSEFQHFLEASGYLVELVPLHRTQSLSNKRVICLAEVHQPLFTACSEEEWAGAKKVLLDSRSSVWVTRGNLLRNGQPEYAMISGLIAAVHTEKKGSHTLSLDLDIDDSIQSDQFTNILQVEARAMDYALGDDFEYRVKKGIIYTSRLVDDEKLNKVANSTEPPPGPPESVVRRSLPMEATLFSKGSQSNEKTQLSAMNSLREHKFDCKASYLLVGCLGGLGKSFAKQMVANGAKNLIFLSRSGISDSETADFVCSLQKSAINVQVIQGDVGVPADVEAAVAAAHGSLKGVVQAALSLKDSFLHAMTLSAFNGTMRPRVLGTLNIHRATLNMDLDFFLLWSSWTKILGSASQANYMASSAFMDAFAQYRQGLALPATSLSLGHMLDVGIVSDHLDYQEHLMRMGLYGNSEREFLQFCAAAIAPYPSEVGTKSFATGHLLAGLEPAGLLAHAPRYPIADMHWYTDPRFTHILQATRHLAGSSSDSSTDANVCVMVDDVSEPLLARIHKRVARCLYMAAEEIEVEKPINGYGIDSMVAAEIRSWLFRALGVSISLLNLLHPTMSVKRLAQEAESQQINRNENKKS